MQRYIQVSDVKTIKLIVLLWLFCFLQSKAAETDTSTHMNTVETDSLQQELLKNIADTTRIETLGMLAKIFRTQNASLALKYANEAYQIAEHIKDSNRRASMLSMIGSIYRIQTDYKKALLYHFQALSLYTKEDVKYVTLNNIGIVYGDLKKYDLSIRYFKETLKSLERIRNLFKDSLTYYSRVIGCYNNIGVILKQSGRVEESIPYYMKGIEIGEKIHSDEMLSTAYINLGDAYITLNQLQTAEYYLKKALELEAHDLLHVINAYWNLGKIYTLQHHFTTAADYLFKAKQISESSGLVANLQLLYKDIAMMYETKKDITNAYKYYKIYHALNDSFLNESSQKQMNELQVKYETATKDEEIKSLHKDKEIIEAKANSDRMLRNSVLAGSCLILIIAIILTRDILHKRKMNRMLNKKNIRIEKQRNEIKKQKREIEKKNHKLKEFNKELLKENVYARYEVLKSKVNPHFLFNSLSTLATLILKEPDRAYEFVSRFSQLYRAIIDVADHNLIPLEKEIRLVKDYFFLQQIRFDKNLHVHFDIHTQDKKNLYLPPFALQIIVENVIKHNIVSDEQPLDIHIDVDSKKITVTNPVQQRKKVIDSIGFGQKNLVERYRMIGKSKPVFKQENQLYISSIPVIEEKKVWPPVPEKIV